VLSLFVRFATPGIWHPPELDIVYYRYSLHQTQQLAAYVHADLQKSTGIRADVAAAKNRESSSIVSNVNVRVTSYLWRTSADQIQDIFGPVITTEKDPQTDDEISQPASYRNYSHRLIEWQPSPHKSFGCLGGFAKTSAEDCNTEQHP
jgi:hypothetical protein